MSLSNRILPETFSRFPTIEIHKIFSNRYLLSNNAGYQSMVAEFLLIITLGLALAMIILPNMKEEYINSLTLSDLIEKKLITLTT